MDEDTVLFNTNGKSILAVGGEEIVGAKGNLLVNDKVKDIEVKDGVITEMTLAERASDKEQALQDAINAANTEIAKVTAAQTAYTNAGGLATAEVYTAVTDAKEALEAAVEEEVTADIKAATKDLTDALTALDEATDALIEADPAKALEEATEAVVKAEGSKLQADVDDALALVNALPESEEKAGLIVRLNKIEVVVETGVKTRGEVTIEGVDGAVSVPEVEEVKAELVLGTLTIKSVLPGTEGNDITVEVVQAEEVARQELEIEVDGNDITITLPTDALEVAVEVTEAELAKALNEEASALVEASTTTDDAVVAPAGKALLEGGVDAKAEKPEVTAKAEVYTLTITNGATETGTIIVKGADANVEVDVVKGMTPSMVAAEIESSTLVATGYTITVDGNKVIFTANADGAVAESLNITVVDK